MNQFGSDPKFVQAPFSDPATDGRPLWQHLASSQIVVMHDELGYYTTLQNRIGDGLADPNRYDGRGK